MPFRFMTIASAVTMLLAALACGGDDGGGQTATPDPDEGKKAEATVTPAAGGTLESPSGGAKLEVPPGAVPAEVKLTVAVAAKESGTAASVYDFGPDGQQFLKPVTLSIRFDGTPGEGKKAVLGVFDAASSSWKEVPNSSFAGGVVKAEVTHFTKYSVLLVDDKAIVTSSCADIAANFQACGGDEKGTWNLEEVCLPETVFGKPMEGCPTAKFDFEIDWSGTAPLDGTKITRQGMKGEFKSLVLSFPATCIQGAPCSALNKEDGSMTCTGTENCQCNMKQDAIDLEAEGEDAYTVADNAFVVTTDDGTDTIPFCRTGDTLVIKRHEEGGEGKGPLDIYMVFKKQ